MAEILAGLGLASNIVQFVDAGIKFLSYAGELYEEGASNENTEAEKIAADIKSITQNFALSAAHDPTLQDLAVTCVRLAKDLHAILQVLKVDTQKDRRVEA